jgi:hypothetical protein
MQENSDVSNVRRRTRFCLSLSEKEILFAHSFIPTIDAPFRLFTLVLSLIDEERRQPPQERPNPHKDSDPQCAIETAILDCLAHVFGGDVFGGSEVSDSAGDFENTIVGAGAKV